MIRGKDVALSLLVVGTAAAAGYVLTAGQSRKTKAKSKANLGARIVDDPPGDATVIDAANRHLGSIPGTRRVIERAIRNHAHEDWEHLTLEREDAWAVVDAIRRSLPYHEGEEHNGVYVRYDDTVIVLDAIGWANLEDPIR